MSTRIVAVRTLALSVLVVTIMWCASVPAAGVAAADGVANDTGNTTVDASVWTAPAAQFASLDSAGDVHEAIENESLTRTRTIAKRDVVVFAIESASTLHALKRERTGSQNYTAAFVSLVTQSDEHDFWMYNVNMSGMADGPYMDVRETTARNGLRVVPDEDNETIYMVMKTDRVAFEGWPIPSHLSGMIYNASLSIGDPVQRRASAEWRVVNRTFQFDTGPGDVVRLGGTFRCHRITGQTSVAPGTQLPFRFDGKGDRYPIEETAVVAADRSVTTMIEADLPSNATFEASVPSFSNATVGVIVGSDSPAILSSAHMENQSVRNGTVTVDNTVTAAGGFIVLYPASVVDDIATRDVTYGCVRTGINRSLATDHIIGVSEYLVPGEHENVTVRLDTPLDRNRTLVAVPHLDTNDNGSFDFPATGPAARHPVYRATDGPAAVNGSLVSDAALVSVDPPAELSTSTPSVTSSADSPTESRTATTVPATHSQQRNRTTAETGPGFTPALALLALLAVALLGTRD